MSARSDLDDACARVARQLWLAMHYARQGRQFDAGIAFERASRESCCLPHDPEPRAFERAILLRNFVRDACARGGRP